MQKLNVRIYDDEPSNVEDWKSALENVEAVARYCEVRGIGRDEFTKGLKSVEERRERARNGKSPAEPDRFQTNCFDEIDIFIIDYDLFEVADHHDLTGEEVAYLVRCFTCCKLIVALNQGVRPDSNLFHLDLRPCPRSSADLNISSRQLHNPGLWGTWQTGARPWYWPNLLRSAEDFGRCVSQLGTLDHKAPVLRTLGLTQDHLGTELPPAIAKQLASGRISPEALTFAEIPELRLRPKDRVWEPARHHITAAVVRAWLDRDVLPPQNILVDAPHLVSRFPSVLRELNENTADLSASLAKDADLGIDSEKISEAKYGPEQWLSRPVWYWNLLSDLDLVENRDPWESPILDAVFCEDLSRFLPKDSARRYHSGLSPEYLHRWVSRPQDPRVQEILRDDTIHYDNDWLLAL